MPQHRSKILFIINPGAGNATINWEQLIRDYPWQQQEQLEFYKLSYPLITGRLRRYIEASRPDKVVAVGGDGTLKLVAECLQRTGIPLGILPAGSANGLARELNIPADPLAALRIIELGRVRSIHTVQINGELCIHLSDVGFNAFVVKKFQTANTRGMWGYVKAAWKVLRAHATLQVNIQANNNTLKRTAVMVVIANATMYGNGVVINPAGSLYDDLFEVVIIKKISLIELFKMRFTQQPFNREKTELFQTTQLTIVSRKKVHFQIDGEYRGRLRAVNAHLEKESLCLLVPN